MTTGTVSFLLFSAVKPVLRKAWRVVGTEKLLLVFFLNEQQNNIELKKNLNIHIQNLFSHTLMSKGEGKQVA